MTERCFLCNSSTHSGYFVNRCWIWLLAFSHSRHTLLPKTMLFYAYFDQILTRLLHFFPLIIFSSQCLLSTAWLGSLEKTPLPPCHGTKSDNQVIIVQNVPIMAFRFYPPQILCNTRGNEASNCLTFTSWEIARLEYTVSWHPPRSLPVHQSISFSQALDEPLPPWAGIIDCVA